MLINIILLHKITAPPTQDIPQDHRSSDPGGTDGTYEEACGAAAVARAPGTADPARRGSPRAVAGPRDQTAGPLRRSGSGRGGPDRPRSPGRPRRPILPPRPERDRAGPGGRSRRRLEPA